jgi:hypothetical protein
MFKYKYQGGAFVEIFGAQGKNPGAKWKVLGVCLQKAICKEFDKETESFMFVLEGNSQTKFSYQKRIRKSLDWSQGFLYLTLIYPGAGLLH